VLDVFVIMVYFFDFILKTEITVHYDNVLYWWTQLVCFMFASCIYLFYSLNSLTKFKARKKSEISECYNSALHSGVSASAVLIVALNSALCCYCLPDVKPVCGISVCSVTDGVLW